MRFSLMVTAASDDPELEAHVMRQVETAIDRWVDRRMGDIVRCVVCGETGRVHPDDDNDLVVMVMGTTMEAVIACEECLKALVFSGIMSRDLDEARQMAAKIVVDVIERGRTAMSDELSQTMGQATVLGIIGDHLRRMENGTGADSSASFKDAIAKMMRE